MWKTATALTAAGLVAVATVSVPNKAEATPAWVLPVAIVGGVAAVALGAAATANANAYYYQPAGTVYVQPRAQATCQIVRERTASGAIRRIEVCN
jgi:hypothetical protein